MKTACRATRASSYIRSGCSGLGTHRNFGFTYMHVLVFIHN